MSGSPIRRGVVEQPEFSRSFHQRVALIAAGQHVRYVPGAFASAMISCGAALPDVSAGRIRSITLTRPADSFAHRIGPPTQGGFTVKFYRMRRLDDSASLIYEHHPRCTYAEGD